MTAKQLHFRIRLIAGLFVLVVIGIGIKLYQVQIVNGEEYGERASGQYVRVPTTLFDRGEIFFSNRGGQTIPAATIKTGYTVAINPTIIDEPAQLYEEIKPIFGEIITREEFIEQASKEEDTYEEIAKRVPADVVQQLDAAEIDNVMTFKEQWRYYPGGELAAHTIGFMSFDGSDERRGTYGLEKHYDDTLARKKDNLFNNFFAEAFLQAKSNISNEGEGDLVTTLDSTIQSNLEDELKDLQSNWNSSAVGGIIMHPKTGEIYAMAATPSFDLNNFQSVESVEVFSNPMISNVYEMGSIFKPLTVAYGLDKNAILPTTTYNDTGVVNVNGARILNYDGRARGVVSMQEVLNQSLNTGVAFIVDRLGNRVFENYLDKSGIRSQTGIDLPNEASPLVDNLDSPRDIEYVTASFGQGIAITPVSMIRALSTLGNGGTLPEPHIVKEVKYGIGGSKQKEKEEVRVISEQTSTTISRMLVSVVDDALRGGNESLENFSIAAKTGTAQMAGSGGSYSEDDFLHTFFGYFPAYEPEFIILLLNEKPQGARYASETLTDPFMNLTKFLINYANIAPDRNI